MKKEVIRTDDAPAAIGPYEQAVSVGGMLYTSGQIPLDPANGQVVGDFHGTGMISALRPGLRALVDLAAILTWLVSAGTSLSAEIVVTSSADSQSAISSASLTFR